MAKPIQSKQLKRVLVALAQVAELEKIEGEKRDASESVLLQTPQWRRYAHPPLVAVAALTPAAPRLPCRCFFGLLLRIGCISNVACREFREAWKEAEPVTESQPEPKPGPKPEPEPCLAAAGYGQSEGTVSLELHNQLVAELLETKSQRDAAVVGWEKAAAEREVLLKQTKELAAELNQLKEDWMAAW